MFLKHISLIISLTMFIMNGLTCLCLQFMDDSVNAMRDYQAAIELDETYSLAYFNAGNVYFHSRQFSQVTYLIFNIEI